jgi:hypothetical protein
MSSDILCRLAWVVVISLVFHAIFSIAHVRSLGGKGGRLLFCCATSTLVVSTLLWIFVNFVGYVGGSTK